MSPHTGLHRQETCPDCVTSLRHSPASVTLSVDALGDRLVVTVSGELDLDSGPILQQTLSEALARTTTGLELDLTGVTFCDCAALNVLLYIRQRARAAAKTVTLRAAGPTVQRLLTLTGTLSLFMQDEAASDELGRASDLVLSWYRDSGVPRARQSADRSQPPAPARTPAPPPDPRHQVAAG